MVKSFRKGTARWLSSQGHPGYGPDFAAKIWARVQAILRDDGDVHWAETSRVFDAMSAADQSQFVWAAISRERMGWAS